MNLRLLIYKMLNRVCRVDITRVMLLDVRNALLLPDNVALTCQSISVSDLVKLGNDGDFQISEGFLEDFKTSGFRGFSATNEGQVVGILFLASQRIAARQNHGGRPFKGIGLRLPTGVFYFFKAAVKPRFRGQKVAGLLMSFAISDLESEALDTVVTTTDWTNQSALNTLENFGFKRCGFASELVVAGRHFYQLPNIELAKTAAASTEHRVIEFTRD